MRSAFVLLVLPVLLAAAGCTAVDPARSGRTASTTAEAGPDATRIYRSCARLDREAKERCYETELISLVEENGVASAMSALEQLAEGDPDVRHLGHVFAHHIGLSAYRPDGDVGKAFLQCTPLFQSGCYHGVVQAFFADPANLGGGADLSAAQLDRLCADHRGAEGDPWLLFQCVHGVGHGLIGVHAGHLPRALEGCDLLPTQWEREGCYGGAFMEVVVSATMPHHGHAALTGSGEHGHHSPGEIAPAGDDHAHGAGRTATGDHEHHEHHDHVHGGTATGAAADAPFRPLDPADPHHPCSSLDARYLPACYSMQTSAVLFWNDGALESGIEFCGEAPDEVRHLCFSSLGRDVSAYTSQDAQKAVTACGTAPANYRSWCYRGVAKHFVDLTADPGDALLFCGLVPEETGRLHCFQAVGEQIAMLTADAERRAALCTAPAHPERRACMLGADLPDPDATMP